MQEYKAPDGRRWFGGVHSVRALLEAPETKVERLCLASDKDDDNLSALSDLALLQGVEVEALAADEIEQIAGKRHQGVAVLCAPPEPLDEAYFNTRLESDTSNILLLFLDGVTDPRNLGACLRTAEACGVDAVIVPADHASDMTPTVLRASAGAAVRTPIVRVANLQRCIKKARDAGVWITGMDGTATDEVYGVDYRRPTAFVLGSEGRGIRRLTREACDYCVSIPMGGDIESLNLSVATAVCLYEARRQRTVVS